MLKHQSPFVLSFSALFLAFVCHCSATQFTVGDSNGWAIPPRATFYSNWSNSHLIRAGDSLEFDFHDKFSNLIQVTKYEYEHCLSFEPLRVFNGSPVIFPLKERGEYFFICSISNYCCLGQKISIFVHESSPSGGNPPSPSPSPSQVPFILPPQLSPNGSSPQPLPNGTITRPPSATPGGNAGNSPLPSSTHGGKSNAVALVCGTSFNVSLGQLFSMLFTFLGFLVM